jgi:O-antigen/teichoic acid export membrane protein
MPKQHEPIFRESKSLRFVQNLRWNLLGQIGILVINFCATPYLVRSMGLEIYGLYVLLHAVSSYLLLLTLASGSTAAKYIAEFKAAGSISGVHQTIVYSGLIHVFGPLLGAGLIWAGAGYCVELFHIPASLAPVAIFVLRCAALGSIFNSFNQLAGSLFQGFQKFKWQNYLALLYGAILPLGVVLAFLSGFGLKAAAVWYVVCSFLICALSWLYAASLLRQLPLDIGGHDLNFKRFVLFSLGLWTGQLTSVFLTQADRAFIARTLPLSDLTLYAVPVNLLQRLQIIPSLIAHTLLPMASEIREESNEELSRMYLKTLRLSLWIVLPILTLLFLLLPQFLSLWIGAEFVGRSIGPARLLIIAQIFYLLNYLPGSLAVARGKAWYYAYASMAQLVLTVAAWIWLIPRYQLLGVAFGALLSQMLLTLCFVPTTHRKFMRLPLRRYLSESLYRPFLSAGFAIAAVLPLQHLASSWPRLLTLGSLGLLAYYGSTWFLLGFEDRGFIKKYLGR